MSPLSDFSKRVYGKSLHDVHWKLFDRGAVLVFGDAAPEITLRVAGIHLMAFRQSLLGPQLLESPGFGAECYIHYFNVHLDSELLQDFLDKRLRFPCDVELYDLHGRRGTSTGQFDKPLHVCLLCAAGALDIICESAEPGQFVG
jgi:hypothetical protein